MSKAVVYGRATCPFCVKAKQLLTEKGVTFTEILLSETFTKEDMIAAIGGRQVTTIPQIILDGVYIGGFTELSAHFASRAP